MVSSNLFQYIVNFIQEFVDGDGGEEDDDDNDEN